MVRYLIGLLVWALSLSPAFAGDTTYVPRTTVENLISQQLTERQVLTLTSEKGKLSVTLAGYAKGFPLNDGQNATPDVQNLVLQTNVNRFTADIQFPGNTERFSVHGSYSEAVAVPVLKQALRSGTVINENDIAWKEIPLQLVRGEIITEADALIGQQPTRRLQANRPIRNGDIMAPYLVKQDEVVQMLYETPFVRLQAPGKALEDGIAGKFIRVQNLDSGKTVLARVTDTNMVTVGNITPKNPAINMVSYEQ